MLKQDRLDFLDLISGSPERVRRAVERLNVRPKGHFEEHPMSRQLVKQHIDDLIDLWTANPCDGSRDWALQFVADSQVADSRLKPLLLAALADARCTFLPTILYTMSTVPDLFADCGALLRALATHPDREVRWRIAYFISKTKVRTPDLLGALAILREDSDSTTQVYVRASGR